MISISPEEMNALDTNCAHFGLSPLQLMENAGAALAREARALAKGSSIAIVAGRGNNGGDAFVAARHLSDHRITVFLVGRAKEITTPEARANWNILQNLRFDLREVSDASQMNLTDYCLILDALMGTGVRGEVRGLEKQAIEAINSCRRPVLAVDVPSGLGTSTAVKPRRTLTFHRPKAGMGAEYQVADIGIPKQAEFFAGPGDLRLVGSRRPDSHKGDSGRVLVIGGGPYRGAPALAGLAALRAGADIATVAAPQDAAETIAGFSPNLIVRPLKGECLNPSHLEVIKGLIDQHDVVVIGMGLGRAPETLQALKDILPLCQKAVVDADALQPGLPLRGIVTPHAGEFRRISGMDLPPGDGRSEVVRLYAKEAGVVVLLKGQVDIISDGSAVRGNLTGNPGMTVGGTGDVLAGVAAALYSIAPPLRAAVAAAYLNGLAGDLAFSEKGYGLLATDVIEHLPQAVGQAWGKRT
ncbi:MAG TPA: NAD(P)H-hydrate dehydratase [Methanotrichaceae archaeon]|nr:NAD(P)H-hydrate dehydratase [Methanotrichaceae archaeon]HQF17122.1 NAD(P)H-hydrate dehydratase [Methanotrichaceae archaeon]HQI91743.1 NAD(P)H-hydrate dehydratase [Methanotrichaceae archaeon]HQJ28966.1 NAD(P)H-hydrate dehydratase [Methanotrichaceae archaeon]